jgi:endonuclease/exonuclease/phosphatase family metal-dependent hydrolase
MRRIPWERSTKGADLTSTTIPRASRRVPIALAALVSAAAALLMLIPAEGAANGSTAPPPAAKKAKKAATVKVMTRNVFLGADLGPAIGASSLPEAISAAGVIYRELLATDFPARSKLLAREIKKAKPHLVGMQEVAHWRVQEPSDLGWTESGGLGQPATDNKYDFLALLMKRLPKYKVVGVNHQFDAELPADVDDDPSTGPLGADLDARLTMRDVIIVRKGSKVKARKKTLKTGDFKTLYTANVGPAEITANRGWLSVEAKVKGSKRRKGGKFRFVNTHLEAFGDPKIREAQAKEMTAKGGPLRAKKKHQVILVGDINSGLKNPHNIGPDGGGSADPDDQLAFKALVKFGMKDRGAQQSCCWPTVIADELGSYRKLTHTVDHVLVKPAIKRLRAYVTGNDPKVQTPNGLLASDHGGVVSKLRLKKRR